MICVEEVEGVNLTSRFFSKHSLMRENTGMTFTVSTPSTGSIAGSPANCRDSDRRNRAKA